MQSLYFTAQVNDLCGETDGECEVFVSKCRVWKFKEADVHINLQEKFNANADAEFAGDFENLWKKLKEKANEVCVISKGTRRHRELWWWNEEWQNDRWKEEIVKDRWKIHFDKLLNAEFEWNNDGLTAVDKVCGPAEIIFRSELQSAITKTKSGKVAGPSGVRVEMLRVSGDVGVLWVTDLCNKIVQEGKFEMTERKVRLWRCIKGKGRPWNADPTGNKVAWSCDEDFSESHWEDNES
jgi:hypothetical protein